MVPGDGAMVTPRLNITIPIVSSSAIMRSIRTHRPETEGISGLISGMRASPTAAAPILTARAGRR